MDERELVARFPGQPEVYLHLDELTGEPADSADREAIAQQHRWESAADVRSVSRAGRGRRLAAARRPAFRLRPQARRNRRRRGAPGYRWWAPTACEGPILDRVVTRWRRRSGLPGGRSGRK